jgi:hypothetical protein
MPGAHLSPHPYAPHALPISFFSSEKLIVISAMTWIDEEKPEIFIHRTNFFISKLHRIHTWYL